MMQVIGFLVLAVVAVLLLVVLITKLDMFAEEID